MIECLSVAQFVYFTGLLGDIVHQIDATLYVVETATQPVYWKLMNSDLWCIIEQQAT